jgi:hypothetical protein
MLRPMNILSSPLRFLALLAVVAAALIAAPSQASHHSRSQVLTLTGTTVDEAQIDVGKPGPSLGDSNVITEDVHRDGKRVGTSDITCTIVRLDLPAHFFRVQCLNTLSLPGGQITSQGIVTSDEIEKVPFRQAVTGGTGAYEGVRGQQTVDEAGDGPAHFTYELTKGV